MQDYILEMKDISKIYGNGIAANKDVDFNLKKGEIHALVGENGAGKSTLMKVLFGMEPPSSGKIILRGENVKFSSSKDAIAHGIFYGGTEHHPWHGAEERAVCKRGRSSALHKGTEQQI